MKLYSIQNGLIVESINRVSREELDKKVVVAKFAIVQKENGVYNNG